MTRTHDIEETAKRFFRRHGFEPMEYIKPTWWYVKISDCSEIVVTNGKFTCSTDNRKSAGSRRDVSLCYEDGKLSAVPWQTGPPLSHFHNTRMGLNKALGFLLGYAVREI